MSLITSEQKTKLDSVFDRLHATFERKITVFKEGERVIIASPSFNHIYRNSNSKNTTQRNVVSREMFVRVAHLDRNFIQERLNVEQNDNLQTLAGRIRIKMKLEDYAWLGETPPSRVEFDGNTYRFISDPSGEGMFSTNFKTFFLERSD